MTNSINLPPVRLVSLTILFTFLAACSNSARGTVTVAPTEQAPVSTSNNSTKETASVPTATLVQPTQTRVPASPSAQSSSRLPGLNDLQDLQGLQALFNQDAGRPRLILLLSMGCPSCLVGAHWIDQVLLEENPDLDVQVYAIWFPTVADNLLTGGINPRWDAETLTDPRVTQFWDPQRVASAWLAENQKFEGPQRSALSRTVSGLIWGKAIWDTYFLYGPQAKWDESLTDLKSSGYPIIERREEIRHSLGASRMPVEAAANPATYQIVPQESLVTYRVNEVFAGKDLNEAVGVTQAITGSIQLDTQNPSQSQVSPIQIDLSTLSSDNRLRDDRIRGEFLESERFPIAVFTPRELKGLPKTFTPGDELNFDMIGDLEVRKTPVPATFNVTASLVDGWLVGTATTIVQMTDFGFDPPTLGAGLVKTDNKVKITFEFAAKPVAK